MSTGASNIFYIWIRGKHSTVIPTSWLINIPPHMQLVISMVTIHSNYSYIHLVALAFNTKLVDNCPIRKLEILT